MFSDALLSYNVPEGTYHSTMWYLSTPEDLNDFAVSDHIQESIRELVSMTNWVYCAMLVRCSILFRDAKYIHLWFLACIFSAFLMNYIAQVFNDHFEFVW